MAVNPAVELKNILKEQGGNDIDLCFQCGLCTGICQWNTVRAFSPRSLIRQAQLGVVDLTEEDIWLCLNCNTCVQGCPRGVDIPDVMRAFRRVVVDMGVAPVPDSLRVAVKSISATGNPFGEPGENRSDWADGCVANTANPDSGLLYFPGCLPSYDPDAQKTARATVKILQSAGVDLKTLGAEEVCCGEAVRMAGNEEVFRNLAETNMRNFDESGMERILTGSPHCFHTFKHDYPEFGMKADVVHTTQFFFELQQQNRLTFSKELNKKIIYQDSCYLGRHNGIYDEPRELLKSIPGVELVEFPDYRENGLCCGGGSGRVWMETKKGERFSDIKMQQAIDAGADILAVVCPYCMTMFRDSRLTVPGGENIELKDVTELIAEAL